MKKIIVLLGLAISAAAYALSVSAQENGQSDGSKTVAWYVANIQEARAKNKECYADPNAKELQATADCVNSLQALKISFAGANQPSIKR